MIQWLEEGSNQPEHAEGNPIKVVGSIRSHQEKKHIMAFMIHEVQSQAEYDAHLLEVVYSHLKLRQLQQKINGQIMGSDGSLSQSMMGGGLGSCCSWCWSPIAWKREGILGTAPWAPPPRLSSNLLP